MYEKVILVTRKTRLQELTERFNTRSQARFYIEHSGGNFSEYLAEDECYRNSLEQVRAGFDAGLKLHVVDRQYVPTFLFGRKDLVVVLGPDGLVANVAKYAGGQPIVGVNPDPHRVDGTLVRFAPGQLRRTLDKILAGKASFRRVTMAEAVLNDGQRLLGFNDLFIGARTHVSARYRLRAGGVAEVQSSSGLLVSTGAGSTGWLSSVFNMARGVTGFVGGSPGEPISLSWEDPQLVYAVREPFASRHSSCQIVAGLMAQGEEILVESLMPSGGTIFSDGIEEDRLEFNSGFTATVRAAPERARLVAC